MSVRNLRQMKRPKIERRQSIAIFFILIVLFAGTFMYNPTRVQAALLSSASVKLNNAQPSASNVTYQETFTFPGTTSIQCIDIIFADTAAHITLTTNPSTTAPSGMTTTSATKASVSGGGLTDGNWTLYNTTNGILQYEYSTGQASTATQITITTNAITNPSSGTFYAQIATYSTLATHTCSGLVDNSNVMALVTTSGVSATATVDPSLTFSVANYGSAVNGSGDTSPVTTTATTIPFGHITGGNSVWGSQTLTLSTNALHGYTIYASYSAQMTDTNNDTFRDQACTSSNCTTAANAIAYDGSSSQSSLGYTADNANVSFGSNHWLGLTTAGAAIASNTSAINSDVTHVEFKIEASNVQVPGTYSTTVIYTAVPTY